MGKSLRLGSEESEKAGWRGMGSPTPTSGFMMSDSARAFPSQGQRPTESGLGFERQGSRPESGVVLGLWERTRRS